MNSIIQKPGEGLDPYGAMRFMVQQILSRVNTAMLVKVVKVQAGGAGPVGSVDVQPLVNQLDGKGDGHELSILHNLPYLRIQGGANAIIVDPEIDDIGIAIFCSRDISTVKRTKKQGNPGSWATHSMSDGLYLGGVLNGAPTQYVQFGSDGITVHSPTKVTISSPHIESTGSWLHTGTMRANDVNIGSDHRHSGVQSGPSNTGTPI